MLPRRLKSVIACGCRFPCRNCDDSVLIIIKSTCMAGCRPLMGLLFHHIGKLGHGGKCGGAGGGGACTCVRLREVLVCADLWLINN